jgi:hypothetical protein
VITGLSIGTFAQVSDQFGSAYAGTFIGTVCGIARQACRVSDQVAVDPDIIVGHAVGTEAFLEATPYLATIQRDRLH